MQNNNNIVCRLCLNLVHGANVELLNEVKRKLLSLLLIKLDLHVSEDPMICSTCSGVLDEIYMFKSNCLCAEDIINTRSDANLKVSLRSMLIEIEDKRNAHIVEDQVICRLCIKIPSNENYIALGKAGEGILVSRDMLRVHLPEIDLSVTEKPIICEVCHVLLKKYVTFSTNCMAVEEKIKVYRNLQSSDTGLVDLGCVLQFAENKALDLQIRLGENLVIERKDDLVPIKVEKVEELDGYMPEGHFVNSNSPEIYLKNEEINIKSEDHEMEMRQIFDGFKCSYCDYKGKHKGHLKRHISTIHERTRATKSEKTFDCDYKTRHKPGLDGHISERKNSTVRSCQQCAFKTFHIHSWQRHRRLHVKKVPYKCASPGCGTGFNSKQHFDDHLLKNHYILHHLITNKINSCTLCPYKTVFSANLTSHIIRSHNRKTAKKYQCHNCDYSAVRKCHLRQHLLVHSNTRPHQCSSCKKIFNHRLSLDSHILNNHQEDADLQGNVTSKIHRCTACTYKTVIKTGLDSHIRSNHIL